MHRFRGDERGVSETIGALMLILIVFAAASSLAIFVQAQQREYQEQRQFEQDRTLERFEVLKVDPVRNTTTGDTWSEANFTVTSLHVQTSYLSGLAVNGEPLVTWRLWRLNETTDQVELQVHERPAEVRIAPRERFVVQVNLTHDPALALNVTFEDQLALEVSTWFGNRFARAFLPPAAIAFVETASVWNGTGYETVLVLDGAASEALAGASLVGWSWDVQPDGLTLHGRKVRAPLQELAAPHTITLQVTDSFGMVDRVSVSYFY